MFDWGGTLTPWHTVDLAEQWRVYARSYSGDAHADELADKILAAEDAAWSRARRDGASARIEEILAEAGVDLSLSGHVQAAAAYEEFWEPHTLLDQQVPGVFAGLRERGIKVGVLSNTIWSGEYHRRVFARDGVEHLIDGAVYSSQIPHAKPAAEAFHAALAAVGVDDPTRAVYVGDRLYEDVHGAQRIGMRAIHVPHSDIPPAQQVQLRDVVPDAVATQLVDVLAHVDRWNAAL